MTCDKCGGTGVAVEPVLVGYGRDTCYEPMEVECDCQQEKVDKVKDPIPEKDGVPDVAY